MPPSLSPSLSSSRSLPLSLTLFVFFLCRLPGYYFEIRSICAIRINTQVGLSTASDAADPCMLFLLLLVALTLSVETSTLICLRTSFCPSAWCWWLFWSCGRSRISFVLSGVPWRAGTPHGPSRQWCQAGSVDQCVSGCFGETLLAICDRI